MCIRTKRRVSARSRLFGNRVFFSHRNGAAVSDTSTLELFAEISIGLVGFAGVVTALGRSRLPAPTQRFRIRALLLYSIIALGGALLPIILFDYGISDISVWVSSAVVLVFAQLVILVWAARTIPPLVREGHLPASLARVVSAFLFVVILYLTYGIIFSRPSLSAIYGVGLFSLFGLGVFHFFNLVISIPFGDEE